jgi:hypothetical protein
MRVVFVQPGCHFVPVPSDAPLPARLRAYCGVEFLLDDVSVLDSQCGTPCSRCLSVAPLPAAESLPQGLQRVCEDVGDGVAMAGNADDVEIGPSARA